MARPKPDHELNYINELIDKDDYVILKITHKPTGRSTEIKLSKQDAEKVKDHYWYYNPYSAKHSAILKTYHKDREIFLTDLLFPDKSKGEKISHKNRDRHDLRRENIIIDTAVSYRRAFKNNITESAIPGVHYYEKETENKTYKYWKVCYRRNGLNKQKSFNINKYGFDKAKKLAEKKRHKWEEKFKEKKG